MDTEKMVKAKKFLAELVEESGSWSSTDLQYEVANELKEILGEFTPTWILDAVKLTDDNSDWMLETHSISPDNKEEVLIFTNIIDSTIRKEDKKVDGVLVESLIKEIPIETYNPINFPTISGGKIMTEDEW